jgi:preprotein translocase subunit SecD
MKKNLLWKVAIILLTLLVFVWGILLGNDPEKSIAAIKQNGLRAGLQQNIHLGLDLKGGTHLILQVMVNDAVNADSDQVIERLKDDLRQKNISYAEISKPDPAANPDRIVIKGIGPNNSSALKTIADERLPEYTLNTGAEGSYVLAMKQQSLTQLKSRAVEQAIETIRNRIDQLGVSEPVIQEHGLGEYQILVQLPGVDDPARVKDIMQSTAMLEIRQAMDNGVSYPSEASALSAHGGILPADSVVMKGRSIARGAEATPITWRAALQPSPAATCAEQNQRTTRMAVRRSAST